MTREQALNWRWETDREPWVMRGNQGTTMAQSQLNTTNAAAQQQGARAQGLENNLQPNLTNAENQLNTLIPMYQSELQGAPSGIMNRAETAATAPIATAAASQNQALQNEAARTRNAAGITAAEDANALQAGQEIGQAAAKTSTGLDTLYSQMGQQGLQNIYNSGTQGLQNLYGKNQAGMLGLYGLGPSTISAWTGANQAANTLGFGNQFLNALGGGLGGALGGRFGG